MKISLLHALPLAAIAAPVRAAYLPEVATTEPGVLVILLACVGLICLMAGGRKDNGPFRHEP